MAVLNFTPWKVAVNRETVIVDESGDIVAQACQTCWPDEGVDEAEDNVRLIAAAPELLEALNALMQASAAREAQHTVANLKALMAAHESARAAIAKVRGDE